MTVTEFLTAKMCFLHTEKLLQHSIQMDLTASCLSARRVEMNGDTSQSTMSLRNAFQIEAVLAINLLKPKFKRPYIIPV
jgi:hypothetical protein